jgi:hypothetical protein
MSATAVRKFAVNHDKDEFIEQYSGVYGEGMTGKVYDEINDAYKKSSIPLQAKYTKRKHYEEEASSTKKRRGGKRTNKRRNRTRKGTKTKKTSLQIHRQVIRRR